MSFTNQALKGVPRTHQVDLLEKYQVVTKEDVLAALKKHFLPLFDSSSSVAVVVTSPVKADDTATQLRNIGFEVTQKELEVDPSEMDDEDGSDSGSDSESDGSH